MTRRPSPSLLIALVALFVALGGPATASHLISGKHIRKGTITGVRVKDGSLGAKELTNGARRALTTTPALSIGAEHIRPGAVNVFKLAPSAVDSSKVVDQSLASVDIAPNAVEADEIAAGAVGASEIRDNAVGAGELRDNSVDGDEIVDGSLRARDIAAYAGSFAFDAAPLGPGQCDVTTITVAPVRATPAPSLADDVIAITPPASVTSAGLVVSAAAESQNGLRVSICNVGAPLTDLGELTYRFVSFDLP